MKSSYSITDIIECPSCGCQFSISNTLTLFRSCDAYVCSSRCSQIRAKLISSIDKKFNNPVSWPMPMQRSQSSVNVNTTTCKMQEDLPIMIDMEDYSKSPVTSIKINRPRNRRFSQQYTVEMPCFLWTFACVTLFIISIFAVI